MHTCDAHELISIPHVTLTSGLFFSLSQPDILSRAVLIGIMHVLYWA